jgi:hypothetical protein
MSTSSNRPRRIYLDSDNRVSGTHDDFEVELPTSVIGCKGMEPISVTIPLTCYPIPAYEANIYFWSSFPALAATMLVATIDTNRNYTNIQELCDAANYAMINNCYRLDTGAKIEAGVNFTYNATTRKVEFTSVGTIKFAGYLDYGKDSPYYHNLLFRMGFAHANSSATYYSNIAGYVAANPGGYVFPSILRTSCIYVSCSLCMSDSMTSSDSGNRDLLLKVPVTSADAVVGSIVQYVNQMKDRTVESMPFTFRRIRVRLLDEEQQPLGIAPTGKGTVSVELRCFYDEK